MGVKMAGMKKLIRVTLSPFSPSYFSQFSLHDLVTSLSTSCTSPLSNFTFVKKCLISIFFTFPPTFRPLSFFALPSPSRSPPPPPFYELLFYSFSSPLIPPSLSLPFLFLTLLHFPLFVCHSTCSFCRLQIIATESCENIFTKLYRRL